MFHFLYVCLWSVQSVYARHLQSIACSSVKGKQLIPGKRDSQKFVVVIPRKTYGTWMNLECFGRPCQTVVLGRKANNVTEVNGVKGELLWHFLFQLMVKSSLKPIVIWKSKNPRCLKKFNKGDLPVNFFSQKKSWMTGEILNSILTKLNRQLSSKERNIMLFLDNAGCIQENWQGSIVIQCTPDKWTTSVPDQSGSYIQLVHISN